MVLTTSIPHKEGTVETSLIEERMVAYEVQLSPHSYVTEIHKPQELKR